MKSSIIKLAFASLLITGFIFSGSVFGQDKSEKKIIKKDMVIIKDDQGPACHFGGLNLTPEQEKSIEQLHMKTMKATLPLKNQIEEKKAHLKTLSSVDNPDMNAINSTIDEISSLHSQMMKLHMANRQEVRKLLNDEQKLKFDIKGGKKMGMGMGKCCGKGKGCGMGPGCGMGQGSGKGPGCGKGMMKGMGKGMGNPDCPYNKMDKDDED